MLVAERLVVEEGQNQSERGGVQFGIGLVEGGAKNRPFEPLSMKLWMNETPLRFVVKIGRAHV